MSIFLCKEHTMKNHLTPQLRDTAQASVLPGLVLPPVVTPIVQVHTVAPENRQSLAWQDDLPPLTERLQRQLNGASELAIFARALQRRYEQDRIYLEALEQSYRQVQDVQNSLKQALDLEKETTQTLEQAYLDTLAYLTRASLYKDRVSGSRLIRLGHYMRVVASHLGLPSAEIDILASVAPMYDVGKIGVSGSVLRKQEALDPQEWQAMKRHTIIGANLLQGGSSHLLEVARGIALTHHEHWDGSGYPQGLKGEDIPLGGRIMLLADRYDALRSQRPHKAAFDHSKTCAILLQGDARSRPEHFDPKILEVFRKAHPEFDEIFRKFT